MSIRRTITSSPTEELFQILWTLMNTMEALHTATARPSRTTSITITMLCQTITFLTITMRTLLKTSTYNHLTTRCTVSKCGTSLQCIQATMDMDLNMHQSCSSNTRADLVSNSDIPMSSRLMLSSLWRMTASLQDLLAETNSAKVPATPAWVTQVKDFRDQPATKSEPTKLSQSSIRQWPRLPAKTPAPKWSHLLTRETFTSKTRMEPSIETNTQASPTSMKLKFMHSLH